MPAALTGVALIVYALASVLLTEGNMVGHFCKLLLIGGFVLGVLAPRATFVVWLISCGYLDLLKRLMVFSGRIFADDLFFVLGISPAAFGGITLGILLHGFFGRIQLAMRHLMLLGVACGIVAAIVLMSMRTNGFALRSLGPDVANAGLYSLLLFVVPVLYHDRQSILGLLRAIMICWTPIMFYGVYQAIYGFQEFELEYLARGLSIEIKQLFSARVRAFSTLNSPTALGFVGGAMCALAVILQKRPQRPDHDRGLAPLLAVVLAATYAAGMMASTVRTALILPILGLIAGAAFRQRGLTWLLYVGLMLVFAVVVLSADFVLHRIFVWNDLATSGALSRLLGSEMVSIGTFSDRLTGFRNVLSNPAAYTPFGYGSTRGLDPSDPLYNHDLLSNIIVRYGCVPLGVMLVVATAVMRKVHGAVQSVECPDQRHLGAGCLGVAFALFAASMVSGNVLATFPNNVFFWMLLSITTTIAFGSRRVKNDVPAARPASPFALGQPAFASAARRFGS